MVKIRAKHGYLLLFLVLSFQTCSGLRLKRSPLEFYSLTNFLKQFLGWDRYAIGGEVTNLVGKKLTLQLETRKTTESNLVYETFEADSNGSFRFPGLHQDLTSYKVTILVQPSEPAQVCEVTASEGQINANNITTVGVQCGDAIYVAAPVYSPPQSEYYSALSVQITTTTSGAVIYYSLDGNPPDCSGSNGTIYSGSVNLAGPSAPPTIEAYDLRAIACKEGRSSSVQRGEYTVTNGLLGTPTFSLPAGNYPSAISLDINPPGSPLGTAVHYTLDGSLPNCSSPSGSPVSIASSSTVRAISCLAGYTKSSVVDAYYEITGTVAQTSFSVLGGTFYNDQSLTLSTPTSGASIRYIMTTDGSTPSDPDCSSSTLYSYPIPLSIDDTRIKAIACRPTWTDSSIVSQTYRFTAANPLLSPVAGTYQNGISVSASSSSTGAVIHYNLGSAASCSDSPSPIVLNLTGAETTNDVYAIACKTNYSSSSVVSGTYVMTGTLPIPVFSLPAGAYPGTQSVTVSPGAGSPPGTNIHYTTNGTTPDCLSPTSPNPISVNASMTIQAIACKDTPLWTSSSVTSAGFTINGQVNAPAFSANPGLESGIYANDQTITLSSTTPGATIRYTLGDGSQAAPTCATGTVGSSVSITSNTNNTIKAIACKTDFLDSNLSTSASYTLKAGTPSPSLTPGVYQTAQTISFSNTTSGVSTHVTHGASPADPNCGSPTGSVTIPLNTANYIVKAISCKAGYTDSDLFTGTYTITGTVPSPTLSGPTGLGNTITVTANLPPSTQTLCYKIGSDPECSSTNGGTALSTGGYCASGTTVYSTSVPIATSSDFRARSCSTDYTQSSVVSQSVVISGSVGTVTFTPDPNTVAYNDYTTALTATGSSHIYYRTDGVNPDCTGVSATEYSGPISITARNQNIRAIGCAALTSPSAVVSKTSNLQVATPSRVSPASDGGFSNDLVSTWSTSTTGAALYFRIDASAPDCENLAAAGTYSYGSGVSMPVAGSGGYHNLRVVGCKSNYSASTAGTSLFNFTVSDPVFKLGNVNFLPASATLPNSNFVLSSTTSTATICLTDNGTTPACDSSGGCMIGSPSANYLHASSRTVSMVACKTNYGSSSVATKTLTISSPVLRVFVSETATDGLMSTANADSLCNNDLARPYYGSNYKAVRMGGGRNGTTDWVLLKGWDYYRTDGTTLIGTTQSGAGLGWTSGTFVNSIGISGANVFTGIDMDGSGNMNESGFSCSGWTTNDGASYARSGTAGSNSSTAFANGANTCATSSKLYCAEQPAVKRIYLTNTPVLVSVNIAGFDSSCNSDGQKPTTGTYKALVYGSARNPSIDWPLAANTLYVRTDMVTPIGETNSQREFTFPLRHSISSTAATNVLTGINPSGSPWVLGNNCDNFVNFILGPTATMGSSTSTGTAALNDNNAGCTLLTARLYCVEQ
ncbi:chitobiase/beta-hexosaminidase C-terminal domain-containing protein [Leptospira idonii]|uniref:DUF1554 domain-containing protein n=1 Tax=Leptospira idonii TaxID=1193500 RepID=A0A4R9M0P7_9LEPT|nr:chitobiase/beta-hexosaminidase C-terminal domain-containing protein [Leptospira idonii]TGN19237.1 DUF1554 domain-containing protein [Leptospira idonii]